MLVLRGKLAAFSTIALLPVLISIARAAPSISRGNHQTTIIRHKDSSASAARRAYAEGEKLRAEQNVESYRQALKKYEECLTGWRAVGDKSQEASTLKTIGDVCRLLNDVKRALTYYNRALLLCQELGDIRLEGEVLNEIGSAHLHLGENQKALEYCSKALQLSREVHDQKAEANALNNMGEVSYAFGDLTKALDYYKDALPLWRGLGDRRGQAQTILYLGYSFSDLGDSRNALESYNEALGLWRVIGDRRGEALTLIALGHLRSRLGEKQEALNYYRQAMPLIQVVGDWVWQGSILVSTGSIYQELGDHQRALDYYDRAVRAFRAASYPKGIASSLWLTGRVYYSTGDNAKSLRLFQEALSVIRSLSDRRLEPYAISDLGAVCDSMGAKSKALEYYNEALSLYRRGQDRRGEAYALNNIGGVYYGLGDKEKARDCYGKALALNRAVGDRFGETSTLYNIARVERDFGNFGEARDSIEAALDLNETLRVKVGAQELRASYFATVQQNYELYVDLLMRLHKLRPLDGLAAAALRASERGRARSLIEMLSEARANIRQGVDAALLDRERALQASLTEKEERYSRLLAGKHTDEHSAATAKEMESIRTEYQQVQALIRATSPRYAALTQPQPLSLEEIQEQTLGPDTLLLEYALGDERSYLWAVTSDSLTSFELPKRADIETVARRVYDLLTAKNQIVKGETEPRKQRRLSRAEAGYSNAAAALSQMLIGPVASQLGTKRLLIVADGALQYIPFGALPVPAATGMASLAPASSAQENNQAPASNFQPLIVEHEIVSLPSASTLAVMRRELANRKPAPKAVAVLADPVFSRSDPRVNSSHGSRTRQDAVSTPRDFERAIREVRVSRRRSGVARLPFSRAEAGAIKAAAPAGQAMEAVDFDATRAMATSEELSQYRIIHFATHGLLNSEHPELSGLVFSLVDRQGKSQNGFLRLHEVYNLNLPAELVVLSACQTGLGRDVKGEGLVGLTRGFMYAGAARVVASLWQVDDSATAELMQRFYTKMLVDGLRPAAALRDAQVEMWKQKRWQAPYYWAGFMLQGEWK